MRVTNRLFLVFCWVLGMGPALAQPVPLGAGAYHLSPKGSDPRPPAAPFRTAEMLKTAAQTNQWFSSLIFNEQPETIFAQPLTVKATQAGFEVALPSKVVVPTVRRDVEIHYPHTDPVVVMPTGFSLGRAKLARASDWSIDIDMAQGSDLLRATVSHGSPYVYFTLSRGDAQFQLPAGSKGQADAADPRVLALSVNGKAYAAFGPQGVRWEQTAPTTWVARLPQDKRYFSLAALPDAQPETRALFARHAYAFIENTRVEWRYDQEKSQVSTQFNASTRAMEGDETRPLLGLYPHHWFQNDSVKDRLGPAFDTIRGKIHVLADNTFTTTRAYNGWVPFWPAVDTQGAPHDLKAVMSSDLRSARRMMLREGNGPYWQGKGLLRTVKLLDVFEQQGDQDGADRLLAMVKERIEEWFSGTDRKRYFQYDKTLGTLVAHPEEYFSIEQMNDHHFHYGYWIRAVAEIALRDPAWAAKGQWGGMVDKLISDIAHPERGASDFPFLRAFDPYEGHSWASGIGLGESGNNQESSSEAVNAWAGLILWGEITDNPALRDLGIYLYSTEVEAINHYWFDRHGLVFAPEYKNVETSMLFGGKYAHNTWWTDEPRQIKGINLLPITTGSTYLGQDPAYVQRNLDALVPEMAIYAEHGKKPNNPPPADIWQDIFAKYQALADPERALASWDRWGSVELGDSRTHALHFMLSLKALGQPDFSVTANTPFYAVFKDKTGRRVHLAYNARTTPLEVLFSDGTRLNVAPKSLARAQ